MTRGEMVVGSWTAGAVLELLISVFLLRRTICPMQAEGLPTVNSLQLIVYTPETRACTAATG
ncbi:hypothetical protein GCM10017602_35460 [Herbiconiux flava]|nr:hypothetical protein GCM10017602_35460 [Herbiconiux flava]